MSYPYILKTSSLREFLRKIKEREIGVPEKLTTADLPALGFTSSNDRPIIRILKFIGFLSEDNKPTQNFKEFRSKERSGIVMANCLITAYKELFELYPDAYKKRDEELEDFFSTKLTGSQRVIKAAVKTFKVLCEFADFGPEETIEIEKTVEAEVIKTKHIAPQQIVLNLNIQIQLPVTEDVEVYDKIFEALRRHIIFRELETD